LTQIPLNDLARGNIFDAREELNLIAQVLRSGNYLKSRFTVQFESLISIRTQGKKVIGVANGTDALTLAYLGLGLKQGDLILTTPNSGGYATTAAFLLGLNVGLIDIDPISAQMSPESLKVFLEIDTNVKAVVLTHLYGQIGEVEQIIEICQRHGIPVIEDCAQSFGAGKLAKKAGSFGDVATFSFYPTKNLGAIGDAGAVAFKDETAYKLASVLAQYGWKDRYIISENRGFNSRIDEIQAAVLIFREKFVDLNNDRRRRIVSIYNDNCSLPRFIIGESNESFVGHLAILVTPNRKSDQQKLNSLRIDTGIHYPVLDHKQPAWIGKFKYFDLSNSEKMADSILTLPCFPGMTEKEIDRVAGALQEL
jgi:dTDP-4-amino-4,6-dideoxygalactose transaminase